MSASDNGKRGEIAVRVRVGVMGDWVIGGRERGTRAVRRMDELWLEGRGRYGDGYVEGKGGGERETGRNTERHSYHRDHSRGVGT